MAGAKFAGRCFLNNFRITCPDFYLETYEILQTYNKPNDILQHLLQVELRHDGERDPTWPGPVCFPWIVKPHEISWNASLEDALSTFNLNICGRIYFSLSFLPYYILIWHSQNRWTRCLRWPPPLDGNIIPDLVATTQALEGAQSILASIKSQLMDDGIEESQQHPWTYWYWAVNQP